MPILKLNSPLKSKITKFVKIEKTIREKKAFKNALSGGENVYLCFPIFLDFKEIVLFHYQKILHIDMCF